VIDTENRITALVEFEINTLRAQNEILMSQLDSLHDLSAEILKRLNSTNARVCCF
jgi:chaperonin cofactor prefoldin